MIRWNQWGKYAIVSVPYPKIEIDRVIKLKGYSISKVFDGTSPTYILWRLPSTWLGKFENLEGAKAKAEELEKLSTE